MPFRVLGLAEMKPVAQRWLQYPLVPLLRSAGWSVYPFRVACRQQYDSGADERLV